MCWFLDIWGLVSLVDCVSILSTIEALESLKVVQSSVLNDQFLLVIKVLHSVLQSPSLKGTQTRERRTIGACVARAVELLEGLLPRGAPRGLRGGDPSTLAGGRGGPCQAWGPLLCGEGVVWVRRVCAGPSHVELEFRVRGMALTQ